MIKHHLHDISNGASRQFYLFVLGATVILVVGVFLIHKNIGDLSKFGYAGLFLINFISSATVFFPLPGVASVFIGGAIFSPLFVSLSSGLGASLGELSGYLLGFGSRGVLNHRLSGSRRFMKVQHWFNQGGFVTILLIALVPLPIFDVVGFLAGSVQYPVWKFVLATFLGRSIRNFLIAWAGAKVLPL